MKSKKALGIQAKVLGILLPCVIIILGIILFLFYSNISKLVVKKSEEVLTTETENVVNQISAWMDRTITALNAERDAIEYFSLEEDDELNYIKHLADQYDSFPAGIYFATTQGKLIHASFVAGSDYNVFEKDWYKEGINSENFAFRAVYLDANTNTYVVGVSGILRDKNGSVRGVAAADIYLDTISEIVRPIQIEETGAVFLIDSSTGTVIGSKDDQLAGSIIEENQEGMYGFIAGQMKKKSEGLHTYKSADGSRTYIDLKLVPNSDWVTVSYVPEAEVMKDLNSLVRTLVMFAVLSMVILTTLIVLLIRRSIVSPVKKIDYVARRIADGQLDESIEYHSGDEFGQLADSFNRTVSRLRDYVNYIDEISKILEELAGGELDFKLVYDYAGEFAKVKAALLHISSSLNDTLGQINQSAEQVSVGADQVADGAQALSQGTTEQAASIEKLSATMDEIAGKVLRNADYAKEANDKAASVGREAEESNRRMQDMLTAMSDISSSSNEISKIIKTIEDIAFQTNILALNAAVEAARAGAAGKGFAVVADEVRNLANKSSEASKDTAALIEGSLHAVEHGIKIADETAGSLSLVVDGVGEVSKTVEKISLSSNDQAQSITVVTEGMDQIAGVVQMNSATAEESAAASEELSGQAQMLKDLVGRFHLKEEK